MLLYRVITLICIIFCEIYGLRDGLHPLVVDYNEHYYYESLKAKITESLSISNCTASGDISLGVKNGRKGDIQVKEQPPSQYILAKWSAENPARPRKLFQKISDNMCSASKYTFVVKGQYKRAKGCYKVYWPDRAGIMRKRFNDYGATLHPEHVRCENEHLQGLCTKGAATVVTIPEKLRALHEYPFMVTADRVIVGRGGMFGMPCGPFGLFASCEAVKWGVPAANITVEHVETCRQSGDGGGDGSHVCPYTKVGRVFAMTQYDDTQIGQFMQEALPKLIYNLDWLYQNPDVLIQFGFTKQPTIPAYVLPHNFFKWLKLDHRLIVGPVYAEQVYMPREGGCQDIGYNAWEVVTMRELFLRKLDIHETAQFQIKPPYSTSMQKTVLVLTRSPGEFTQNKADYTTRRWPKDKYPLMLQALAENFPGYKVEVFSDQNKTLMTCPLCQAEAFFRADVVIGMHGAGLSNAMFMRPGSVVVEVVYDFDARHAPIIGIFPRLSSIVGLHHYTVFIRDVGLDVIKLANETAKFTSQTKMWS